MKRLSVALHSLAASVLAVVAASAQAEAVVGLTTTNALVRFDSATPINASLPINITGLVGTNEQIIGIAPADYGCAVRPGQQRSPLHAEY